MKLGENAKNRSRLIPGHVVSNCLSLLRNLEYLWMLFFDFQTCVSADCAEEKNRTCEPER